MTASGDGIMFMMLPPTLFAILVDLFLRRRASQSILFGLLRILLLSCLAAGWLRAESEINFPRVSFQEETIIGLAIVNPNGETASVVLTAFGPDGSVLDLPENPATIAIPPEEQFAKTAREIFGSVSSPPAVAWVQGQSESNDLTGFFLYLNSSVTFFDGADLPESSEAIVFNVVRVDEGYSTELDLINPNETEVIVDLELLGGEVTLGRSLTIPSKGMERMDLASLFEVQEEPEPPGAYFVIAEADQPIAGVEFIGAEGDLLGVNARPATEQLNTLVFPQLAVLDVWVSEVTVVNYSDSAVILTIEAHEPDGSLYQPAQGVNPVNRELGPKEASRYDVEEELGFAGAQTLDGWLRVESTAEAINGVLTYAVPSIRSIAAVSSVGQGSKAALFSHIATTLGFFTGVAVLNTGSLAANLQVMALKPEGDEIGRFETTLSPGQRISQLIEELVPGAADQAGGLIYVSSDIPVYLTSLFGSTGSGVLANIPPQLVPDEYEPGNERERARISPGLAVLQPGAVQDFELEGISGPSQWFVNLVEGGSPEVGDIDSEGVYRAPEVIPSPLPVVVTAASGGATAGASVDLLSKEQLLGNLGSVQSVAYLSGARKLFVAALLALGGQQKSGVLGQQDSSTAIRDVTSGVPVEIARFDGDSISNMVPYTAVDGEEYLILAGETSGTIRRLDPDPENSEPVVTVLSGLDRPSAVVIDSIEGELLVAEATRVQSFSLDVLDTGLIPVAVPNSGYAAQLVGGSKILETVAGRVAVDQCTGNIYASVGAEGVVLELVRFSGAVRAVATGLSDPGPLLGFYRKGSSCPAAFHLLVVERGIESLTVVVPFNGLVRRWINVSKARDVIFLPPSNPFVSGSAVLVAEESQGKGQISVIRTPDLYLAKSVNPPRRPPRGPCAIRQVTEIQGADIDGISISSDGSLLAFAVAADLTGENRDLETEVFFLDRKSGNLSQVTQTPDGTNFGPVLSGNGKKLIYLRRETGSPEARLRVLDLESNLVGDLPGSPVAGASIDNSGDRIVYSSLADPVGGNPDGGFELFLFESGGGLRQLTDSGDQASYFPIISGDGRIVTFFSSADLTGHNPDGGEALYRLNLETPPVLTFLSATSIKPRPLEPRGLVVSNSGSRIAFTSSLDLTGENPSLRRVVYVIDEQGGLRQLTSTKADSLVTSMDGHGDLLAGVTTGNPLRLNKDGNQEVFFFRLPSFVQQVTRSRRAINSVPQLSSGATELIFRSDADFVGRNPDRSRELFFGDCRPE